MNHRVCISWRAYFSHHILKQLSRFRTLYILLHSLNHATSSHWLNCSLTHLPIIILLSNFLVMSLPLPIPYPTFHHMATQIRYYPIIQSLYYSIILTLSSGHSATQTLNYPIPLFHNIWLNFTGHSLNQIPNRPLCLSLRKLVAYSLLHHNPTSSC